MKIRYKKYPSDEFNSSQLNVLALNEVLTGDDSAYFHDLEVFIESKQEWKCLRQAFKDRDVITDNYNMYFREAQTPEEKAKGWFD